MRTVFFAAILLSLLARPASLAGQERASITFLPRAGVLVQTSPFEVEFDDVPGFTQHWHYRFQPGVALGAAAELRAPGFPVALRGEVSFAPALTLEEDDDNLGPELYGPGEEPGGSLTAATVAAVLASDRLCLGPLCPRLLVGGGIKRYHFDAEVLSGDIVSRFAEDQTQTTLQVGVGLAARLRRALLVAEVNDYSNSVDYAFTDNDGGRVHDTVFSLSVAVPLR